MREHEVHPAKGSKVERFRVGRGLGSGNGVYAGKGVKGQKARRGYTVRPGFEGGQTPMIKRLPQQRGFRNPFRIEYHPVNLEALERFEAGSVVTPEEMRKAGIVHDLKLPIKVLGDGDLTKALTVRANKFSASAKQKIEAANGKAEELPAATTPA
ncbi:MAG: 50S ribosomal protein L15 [Chloroflexi bacterium]|nr:50S ribosomal protein L15 [Chloroflexota bacterium]